MTGAEYAPQPILDLFAAIKRRMPAAELSGVLGDRAHTYGYHRARNVLPASDYSVQLAGDRAGDGWAASALDVKLPDELMRLVTRRLLTAAQAHDPRLRAVREFCGTLNGAETFPWDIAGGNRSEGVGSWDASHLWHIHLSFLRSYATDAAALAPIAGVILGDAPPTPPPPPKDAAMSSLSDADVQRIAAAVWAHPIVNPDNKVSRPAADRLLDTELEARAAAPHPATPPRPAAHK